MKKRYLICLILVLSYVCLVAELAWQQPISLRNFDNVRYRGEALQTADNSRLLLWEDTTSGTVQTRLCLYDSQYQPLWAQAIPLNTPFGILDVVETTDSCFVLVFNNSGVKAIKLSRNGAFLWGQEGVSVSGITLTNANAEIKADLQGGVFISWYGELAQHWRTLIQHLGSSGAISMPSGGVFLDNGQDTYFPDMMLMPDNSVLIKWTIHNGIRVNRINSSGQFLWSQPMSIASPSNYPRAFFCSLADGSVILCANHYDYLDLRRFDATGTELWPEPVTALTVSSISSFSVRVAQSDNSVLIMADAWSGEYLQKVSADGVIQYPGGISLSEEFGYIDSYTDIVPDDQGGCVVVACTWGNPNNIKALQVNAAGDLTIIPITESASRKEAPTAYYSESGLHIEWQQSTATECGICVQILDNQMNAQLAENGAPLRYGATGNIGKVLLAAGTNHCTVVWQQAPYNSNSWELRMQLINNSGQALLEPDGVRVNQQGSSVGNSWQVSSNGTNSLLVWSEQMNGLSTLRCQILTDNGSMLFPNGGTAVTSDIQSVGGVDAVCYMGDWYIVWCTGNIIKGQRISGTQLLWGDGYILTQQNPEIGGYPVSCHLDWPWLSWIVLNSENSDYPVFAKALDVDGATLPNFPDYGVCLVADDATHQYRDHILTVCGETLHAIITYYDPQTPSSYGILYREHTIININGETVYGPQYLNTYDNFNIFADENQLYVGDYNSYNNLGYRLRVLDNDGNELMPVFIPISGYTDTSWEVSQSKFLSNDDLLLLVLRYNVLRYMYITPQWNLDTSADNIVFSNGSYNSPPVVSIPGNRAWIAWVHGHIYNNTGSVGVSLQAVIRDGLSNTDEVNVTPVKPLLESCSPNPFNPSISISFSIPQAGRTKLAVYDLRGRKICVLLDDALSDGTHKISWDGRTDDGKNAASGIYFLRLESGGKSQIRKVTLMK